MRTWSAGALLLLAVALAGAGCAESKGGKTGLSYGATARTNYDRGMRELADENFPEAIKYFDFVRSKFPFSRFSTLAELRIADTCFAQEKYPEASDAYRLFIKFHPTHPQVLDGYAAYRAAESHLKQIPGDWFLLPPGCEKDQSATRNALGELVAFIRLYPQSKYLHRATKLRRDCVRRLVDHELYVARFYLERDKPQATILRLEGVLRRFPDAGVDPQVMLLLGQTYLRLNQRARARATFAGLVEKYPRDHHSAKARLYLEYLGAERN